ncbi:hypothetical protein ACGIF2_16870 [Cellulomonas sp. P22]|uniref:restriction system modified-DNA reader domain-containing protein n=1 Tax=Cellulomonas sp. P22 TaxID=3373189 RepID=UPI0037917607
MPIFELDEGRPLLVQPMQPAAGTFAPDSAALVTEHLEALVGEELFPVHTRTVGPDGVQLLALDAAIRPVVVETVPVLDVTTLVRALNHAGAAATSTRGELVRAYDGGRSAFDADLASFRERVPMRGGAAPSTSVRLVIVCAEVAPEVSAAVTFLRSTGRHVEVLQTGVVQGADGRRFVEVSAWSHDSGARRAVEPALPHRASSADGVRLDVVHVLTGAQPQVPTQGQPAPSGAPSGATSAPLPTATTAIPFTSIPFTSVPVTGADHEPTVAPEPTAAPQPIDAPRPVTVPEPRPEQGRRYGQPALSPARPTPASARVDETVVLPGGFVDLDDLDEDVARTRPAVDRWDALTRTTPDAARSEAEARWQPPTGATSLAWLPDAPPGLLDVAPSPRQPDAPARRDPYGDWPEPVGRSATSWSSAPATSPTPTVTANPVVARPVPEPELRASRTASAVPPPAGLEPWTGGHGLPAPRPHPALSALSASRGTIATLVWFRARRGQRLVATLRTDGLIELPDGRLHADPDDAAADAANAEGTVDGWRSWRLGDAGPTLAEATGTR